MLENINFYIMKNHPSVTRLIQFVYKCQIFITTEFKIPNMICDPGQGNCLPLKVFQIYFTSWYPSAICEF